MVMASRKSFAKEIETDIICKVTPVQMTMIASVYITYETNCQIS